MITLQNEQLSVGISALGAELQQLESAAGLHYLWSGDKKFWGKFSPVLFPIIGTLVNDTYTYGGKAYSLPRHGFARDRVFDALPVSNTEAVFTLKSDEDSLRVYPFPFALRLRYVLDGRCLSLTYIVVNTGTSDMYFSIGGHPAFAVPLTSDTSYTDYYLQFNGKEPLKRWKLQDGLLSGENTPVNAHGGRINLDPALFYEDALVFRHLQSTEVTLGSDRHGHGLRFRFDGFPYLGIWAAKDAPFLCIEPWCGHADMVGHNQHLTEKEGIEKLSSGAVWQRTWSVECF